MELQKKKPQHLQHNTPKLEPANPPNALNPKTEKCNTQNTNRPGKRGRAVRLCRVRLPGRNPKPQAVSFLRSEIWRALICFATLG